MNNQIKICVSAHKPTQFVHNSYMVPIQVGTALPGRKCIDGYLHDNEGNNISKKNLQYCELTAQYWAWKNLDVDYYGFFHYRRYLSFNSKLKKKNDEWGNIVEEYIDDDFVNTHKLNEESIFDIVNNYDIILPKKKKILYMPGMGINMREQYLGSGFLNIKDLDLMLEVIKEKYPDYLPFAIKYFEGHETYFNNMFIMKKNIFNDYCKWLFDILAECEKRMDISYYSAEAQRTIGHLAERLLNIYILYIQEKFNYSIKELPTVFIKNTDIVPDYRPAFRDNNIAMAFSADENYVPYLATVISSIVYNSSEKNNYDLIVLNKNIKSSSKEKLMRIIESNSNFSIRFLDIGQYENKFSNLFTRGHFTIETWFRLLLGEILENYEKILYLDSDIVVNSDPAELYLKDVSGYFLAATRDADTAGLYNGALKGKKQYMDNILKISKPYDYFQAGVLLLNLTEFRKHYSTDYLLKYSSSYNFELLDQDVLNFLTQGHVLFVDMTWNVMFDWKGYRINNIISKAPRVLFEEYMEARKNPKIIHFAGPDKPWDYPMTDFADIFWKYAKLTPFYEEILLRMVKRKRDTKRVIKERTKSFLNNRMFPTGTYRRIIARKIYEKIK